MNLAYLREKARQSNLTNYEQSKIVGGVRQTIWYKMTGRTDWSVKQIVRFCHAIGLSEAEFMKVIDYNGVADIVNDKEGDNGYSDNG